MRNASVCPLELAIAIHYHTTPLPYAAHDPAHAHAPAVIGITADFVRRGFLVEAAPEDVVKYGADFRGTEALQVWIDALCRVPRPERVWAIPERP